MKMKGKLLFAVLLSSLKLQGLPGSQAPDGEPVLDSASSPSESSNNGDSSKSNENDGSGERPEIQAASSNSNNSAVAITLQKDGNAITLSLKFLVDTTKEGPAIRTPLGNENPGGESPGSENGEKPGKEKPDGEKPGKEKPDGEKPGKEKPDGEKPGKENPDGEKPGKEKPDQGNTTRPGNTTDPGNTTNPGGGGSEMQKKALELHNKFRKVHGVPPMTLNDEMSKEAEAYAKKIADMGTLEHSSKEERKDQGENLSRGCSSDKGQEPEEAITKWYNEVCSPGYTFGGKSGRGGTGHFTQVVWKESVELGFGRATVEEKGMKCAYYVGRYKKAGNMEGTYDKNVPQGKFDKQSYCANVKSGSKQSNFVANN